MVCLLIMRDLGRERLSIPPFCFAKRMGHPQRQQVLRLRRQTTSPALRMTTTHERCGAAHLMMVKGSVSRIFLTRFQPSSTLIPIEPSGFCSQYSMSKPPYSKVTVSFCESSGPAQEMVLTATSLKVNLRNAAARRRTARRFTKDESDGLKGSAAARHLKKDGGRFVCLSRNANWVECHLAGAGAGGLRSYVQRLFDFECVVVDFEDLAVRRVMDRGLLRIAGEIDLGLAIEVGAVVMLKPHACSDRHAD